MTDERNPGEERPDVQAGGSLAELIADIDHQLAARRGTAADDLADPAAAAAPAAATTRRFLVFSLASTRCALPLEHMQELSGPPRITPLPHVPPWVRGVTSLRGDILAVLDLDLFFELPRPAGLEPTRLLVVTSRRTEVTTGLLADQVHGIADIPEEALRQPAAPIEDRIAPYLAGVVEHDGRLLAMLDLEKLLAAPELRQFEAA